MAIARKPKTARAEKKPPESAVTAVIEKGGSVPGESPSRGEGSKPFLVRMDLSLFEKMNEAVQQNPVFKSRNTWVVNAIYEQLKRDGLV